MQKNDSAVKDAMEAYRSTMNTQDMISSLKQIARKYVVEYDIDDNYNEKSEDDGDEDEEYLRKLEEEAGYERLEDEESEEENDADSEGCDDDLDQMQGRDQIFPVLVNELCKEDLITETDSRVLLNLFSSNNAMLNSALDAYDVDNNLGQLVNTLRQVASRYNHRK